MSITVTDIPAKAKRRPKKAAPKRPAGRIVIKGLLLNSSALAGAQANRLALGAAVPVPEPDPYERRYYPVTGGRSAGRRYMHPAIAAPYGLDKAIRSDYSFDHHKDT